MKTKESALATIADLAKGLAEAAEDRERTAGTLKQILDEIGALDKEDAKALFRDERVQALIEAASEQQAASSVDPPGTIYSGMIGGQTVKGFIKKPWAEADLRGIISRGEMPLVSYTPRTTQPVFWNGLRRQFIADEELTVEKCFVDIYRESLAATKDAASHAAWLFKKSDTLSQPNMVTNGGARARGTGERGHYIPGGGMVAGRAEEEGASEQASP